MFEVDLDSVGSGDAIDELGASATWFHRRRRGSAGFRAGSLAGDDVRGVTGADLTPHERDRVTRIDEASEVEGRSVASLPSA